MGVDNRIETVPGLHKTEKPWSEFHDVKSTEESIQKMLGS